MHVIDMNTQILQANEKVADENKLFFKKHGIFTANLMSAPGAGKTSVLEQTITKIRDEFKVAVIEGDLQTTIDADRISALGIPSHQIVTGTVCHLDARMVHNALHDFKLEGYDLLFIENVGNLVCPAEFNLGEDLKVMVFSVVEGAEKPKKYPLMFHEADAVLLNKIDLIPYSGVSLEELVKNVREVNPKADIFSLSCKTGDGFDKWIAWLTTKIKTLTKE
ncbi:hydrogenase nickel incorporation protein HypB [Bacteroidota bacterium]